MKMFLLTSFSLLFSMCGWSAENNMRLSSANVAGGTLYEYPLFPSQLVAVRNVNVWLPDGYSKDKKYDVVYMHDGQMLFDSTTTWNHQEWQVDETVSTLIREGKIRDCIIVGVWNIPDLRFYDYFPQKTLKYMSGEEYQAFDRELDAKKFDADRYLKFLVTELKPYIDSHFSTNTGQEHTFLMGSSMGALISLYGICEYPEVFGGAACLSMHTLMVTSKVQNLRNTEIAFPAFCRYLKSNLPKPNSAKIYIDYGDKTLDSYYAPYQQKVDDIFYQAGWRTPSWTTNFYPGMSHSESDWARRLFVPLMFLLEK